MNAKLWRKIAIAAAYAAMLALGAAFVLRAQTPADVAGLRDQLRARYDIVMLQDGLGLVPHQRDSSVRLIEIRNGVVAINGETVSARELRERVGRDADLILRTTYMDAAAQRELAQGATAGAAETGRQEMTPVRTQIHSGDMVRFGGDINVGRDERIDGDVVAIGGSATVDGEVSREVTVIGGHLELGPEAVVRGNVAVVGGTLTRSPSARVYGKIDEVGVGRRFERRQAREFPFGARMFRPAGLVGTLPRIALLILSTVIVLALGRRYVELIADRTAAEPLRAGAAGLLAEVLFIPTIVLTVVVLAVSIIGIPLLLLVPFGIVLAVIPMLIGFTGVSFQIGRFLNRRFGMEHGPYATLLLGVVLVVAVTLLSRVAGLAGSFAVGVVFARLLSVLGGLAEFLTWTVGAGAVILTWLSMRRRRTGPAAQGPPSAAPAV